jgi:hypothetical protein
VGTDEQAASRLSIRLLTSRRENVFDVTTEDFTVLLYLHRRFIAMLPAVNLK